MTEPVTILGGGPAGLAVAHYATRAGLSFRLFERAPTLGGLCRTFACGEHRYDSGAHRFHDRDPEVTADLRGLLGDSLRRVSAPSQIYDGGRLVDFPPTPLRLLFSRGVLEAGRVGAEIIASRLRPGAPPRNFSEFAERQFGPSLARRYLLDYSEKLWGLPADQLSPDVATRRLQGMTVTSLLTEVFLPGRRTRHIDGEFLYPRTGYGAIAEALASSLPQDSLHPGSEVTELRCEEGRVRSLVAGGQAVDVSGTLVSTVPLTRLVELVGEALPRIAREAAQRLRFRHVRLVFLRLGQARVSDNASIYVPDPDLVVARVYEPRNRSAAMAPPGETSLVAEVPCFTGDETARLDDEALERRVVEEVVFLGLARRESVLETRHHFLANAYPVYGLGYEREVAAMLSGVAQIGNLDPLGRGGRFFYSHLHDQMRAARDWVAAWERDRGRRPQAVARAAGGR